MAIERSWERQGPIGFTADGGENGVVTVNSVENLKVKQRVKLSSATQPDLVLQIKKVISYTQLIVGPVKDKTKPARPQNNILSRENISAYTLADGATITAVEQPKTGPANVVDIMKAVYEQEPTVALRIFSVDNVGNGYTDSNPFPTRLTFIRDGQSQNVIEDTITPINNRPLPVKLTGFAGDISFAVDNLNLETQLEGIYSALSNINPDSVGMIAHERSAATDDTHQTRRPTAIRGTGADAQTVSQDVALHDEDGNRYSPTNTVPIGIYGNNPEGTRISNIGDSLKVASDSQTPIVIAPKNTLTDAFGRMRVSEPRNIFEWQFRYDISIPVYWDISNVNGATQALDLNSVGYVLNGAAQAGSQAIIQTRRQIEYVPGKSQQVFFTGNFNGTDPAWEKKYGLFDENNGLFFRALGDTLQVVIRSSTTGLVVDDPIDQANWNGDKLDGTGPSGATLDLTTQQLFFIDYAYLGTGNVRFGFYIDGDFVVAHTFKNSNKNPTNYMQSGILPLKFELSAIGTPATTASMQISCMSVTSESIDTEIGKIRGGNTGTTATSFNANETFIFGVRINPLYPYSSLAGVFFELLAASGNSNAIWRIYHNPVLAGPVPTWVDVPSSIAQSIGNVPTVTNGTLIASGYISLTNNAAFSLAQELLTDIFLGRAIDGTPDTLVLTLETTSGNGSAFFSGQWKEIV